MCIRDSGNTVDVNKLEEELGVPVVPISAAKNEGIDELIEHALRAAQLKMLPKRQDFCSGAVHRCIHSLAHIVEDHAEAAGVPMRFAATKLVEEMCIRDRSRSHGCPLPMYSLSSSGWYCVRIPTVSMPELTQLESGKSMMRYLPPNGTAGFASFLVRAYNLEP